MKVSVVKMKRGCDLFFIGVANLYLLSCNSTTLDEDEEEEEEEDDDE